jgi:hypothetical protein
MLKLVSKFAMDIFPSVIATIIGAYIVNHYINNKAPADAATAAAVSTADPKKANARGEPKPAEKSADIGNIPEPGVRAKGIPEKAIIDKSAAEKTVEKPPEKADKPAETASIPPTTPPDSRRHQPTAREKAAAKIAPAAVQAPAPPALPAETVVAAPNTVVPAETGPDANDLARAAIERLHRASTASEPARAPESPRVIAAPAPAPSPAPPAAPQLQPLPPPIMVSTPPDGKPPYPPVARPDDPQRPRPPAEIPDPRPPLDLRADAVEAQPQGRPSVAEDVLSAAKSMFHSVLPK